MAEIKGSFYGTSRPEEEKKYEEIKAVARGKVSSTKDSVQALKQELHELKEVYDVEDKEGLAQWFNTDARFSEVRAELLRAERALRKPYFGRIDVEDSEEGKRETFYIGRSAIAKDPANPEVIDWRAPIASVYYDHSLGKCKYKVPQVGIFEVDLQRKRTYEIEEDKLKDYYDSDVIANDDLLTKYLSKSRRAVLSEIIATIQQEQNNVIRKNPRHNVIVQGSAGSGKTTVAMHRISYILYNYPLEFKPGDFYVVGSNSVLLNYITGVLPDLAVYGVVQMTMGTLFSRLLYEDWDKRNVIRNLEKGDESAGIKGTTAWYKELEAFCTGLERKLFPFEDIRIDTNGHLLLSKTKIKEIFEEYGNRPLREKYERLSDFLMSNLEYEILSKGLSYSDEEKRRLNTKYKNYFNRMYLKEESFEAYEQFVAEQSVKHPELVYISKRPDLYDIAGAAYIYKRLRETEVIQEASHIIIDEAQDFGISVYRTLKYCMNKCTYTIMGDVAQNINLNNGLTDWEELKEIMLPEKFDYFGLLRKSYRNTVEISEFATDILKHASFPIYPVEPVLRHGNLVDITNSESKDELLKQVVKRIKLYKAEEYETIAVICKDSNEAEEVCKALPKELKAVAFTNSDATFTGGVMVLPIEYAKGLEFDAVIIYDASKEKYPKNDGYARLLYVAVTRALHELSVYSLGEVTGLISDPIPEHRKQIQFEMDDFHELPFEFEEEFVTKEEAARRQALEGHGELALRLKYGPKRIVVNSKPTEEKKTVKKPVITASRPVITPVRPAGKTVSTYVKPLDIPKTPKEEKPRVKKSIFGTALEGTSLQPVGHGRIDLSVRWHQEDSKKVDITTPYGVLRIEPVAQDTLFIAFAADGHLHRGGHPKEIKADGSLKWKLNENRESIEIRLGKIGVKVDKRSGVMSFCDSAGKVILKERDSAQRQYHGTKDVWWEYLDFSKKEIITARGNEDWDWQDFTKAAKYVSCCDGSGRDSIIMSNLGYQLVIPAEIKAFLCTIPTYGPYLMFEDAGEIGFYIRSAR